MTGVKNPVLLLLAAIGTAAAWSLAFLTHAPNRLVSGAGISLAEVLSGSPPTLALLGVAGPALLVVAGIVLPPRRSTHAGVLAAATALLAGLVWLAARHAAGLDGDTGDSGGTGGIARTSFGGAFWVLAAVAWLAAGDAIGRLALAPGRRLLAGLLVVAPVVACLAGGLLAPLSLLREYASRRDVFDAALAQHLQLVVASLLPSVLIGLPLGLAVARPGRWRKALRPGLFSVLNIIQTIPSIALFGLLMAPLAWLALQAPLLGQWGIKGVGMAPAVIALTLYSLLPVVRSTAAGLGQVPQPVIDAARGMGLSGRQIFWQVELPLALPLLISGLRVATVQLIGLAVVAALIGAGGFGAIMFQGLLGGALDLALLGTVPVVAMALAVDAVLKAAALSLAHAPSSAISPSQQPTTWTARQ
ncbi:MAG: ABC transporter permease [Polaromonas sp.]|nr:ABC transporter permease [Polaromonas sp.]